MKTKDRSRNQPPLAPPCPRRGNFKLPSSDEEGWGWWDFASLAFFAPWRESGFLMSKTREQSENVYENKGSVKKSTTPDLSLSKEGNYRAPLLGRGGTGSGATL
jgi:hypothetical protein